MRNNEETNRLKGRAIAAVSLRACRSLRAEAAKRGSKTATLDDARALCATEEGARLIVAIAAAASLDDASRIKAVEAWANSDRSDAEPGTTGTTTA